MANNLRAIKWKLFLLGKIYIPILGFTRPRVLVLDEKTVKIKIKLNRRTKNHLRSMYFGALAVGADTAAGIHAMFFSDLKKVNLSFAFKAVEAQFLKRAETDVVFVSNQGADIESWIEESIKTGLRISKPVEVIALNSSEEIVATFKMTISLRVK
jgi:acyl-coenzyme A thioesterase PaaI-like protein